MAMILRNGKVLKMPGTREHSPLQPSPKRSPCLTPLSQSKRINMKTHRQIRHPATRKLVFPGDDSTTSPAQNEKECTQNFQVQKKKNVARHVHRYNELRKLIATNKINVYGRNTRSSWVVVRRQQDGPMPDYIFTEKPDFSRMTWMDWRDDTGSHSLKPIELLSGKWIECGHLLGIGQSQMQNIETKYKSDPVACMVAVLHQWVVNNSDKYPPPQWSSLIELLEKVELVKEADDLRSALLAQ